MQKKTPTTAADQTYATLKKKVEHAAEDVINHVTTKRTATIEDILGLVKENHDSLNSFSREKSANLAMTLNSCATTLDGLNALQQALDKENSKIRSLDRKTEINKYLSQLEAELRSELN